MKTDLDISRSARLKPIVSIARNLGIGRHHIETFGEHKAKVSLYVLKSHKIRRRSKYIVVTGMTPTHFGEGKTVTTIGLSMALNRLGRKSVSCIRQPSLGPFFGVKGGGLGGGYSQAVPYDEININFTGDIHAVSAAHNLCASFLDNHIFRGNKLGIDIDKIFWPRAVDVNDRALRNVRIGIGGPEYGFERTTRFDITAASELMAIIALSKSLEDMRERIGRIIVAFTKGGKGVTCEDLKVAGAMAAILKDAIKPNIVQTIENTPCFIHSGPFANIMHGNSSILADKMALSFSDYVVTESGFGADCGAEKFFDIKCRTSGLKPNAAVLVCSVRALKVHSGMFSAVVGRPLDKKIYSENLEALEAGLSNLEKQVKNVRAFGVPCVVAINRFSSDTEKEMGLVRRMALESGAFDCVVSDLYRKGSRGGIDLAHAVMNACDAKSRFSFLYPSDMTIKKKIGIIAKTLYGASDVRYEKSAEENMTVLERLGAGRLPVCMAKTHLSLSHDPALKGAPKDYILPVRDVRPSIGAGFVYAICGKMLTMPSLSAHPAGEGIDIDSKGRVIYVHG